MNARITDPKTLAFMEFFEKEYGVKFRDVDTGKIIGSDGRYKDEENAL